jgi:D-3-phosphoglycerate dehydrogenase
MSNYLLDGAVENALNMPSMSAEEAKIMGPWVTLAENLGSFIGQVTDEAIKEINVTFDGVASEMNLKALEAAVVAGIMQASNPDVNMVSAPVIAKERGIQISKTTQDATGVFDGYIKLDIQTVEKHRTIAGTVFSDGKPRFIQIKGITIDAEVGEHMLYTTNTDVPGILGKLGTLLAEHDENIANFTLGRTAPGGDAIAVTFLDTPIKATTVNALKDSGLFKHVRPLHFKA